jgi:hypothetical protein
MIQEGGARICTYMRSEVRNVQNRNKGPKAGRKYILGSGNRVWRQSLKCQRGQNPLTSYLISTLLS